MVLGCQSAEKAVFLSWYGYCCSYFESETPLCHLFS